MCKEEARDLQFLTNFCGADELFVNCLCLDHIYCDILSY